jgi:hypothetical protein
MTRKYSSISVEQLLDSPMGAADTTLTLDDAAAVTAILGGVSLGAGNVDQFTIAVDPDTSSEEIIFVRGTSGAQLTGLVRAQAGTSATTHVSGATVKHVLTSNDLDFYTAGVDNAITASSTSTLTNKTLTSPTINDGKLNLTLNAQTGTTYTFVLADNGKLVTASNAATQTYSIPTNASVAFPVGTQINILQLGAGQVTINAVTSGTTTISSTGATATAPKLRAQYSAATCIKTGTDTWVVTGDIA